jgi:hypothetical protein
MNNYLLSITVLLYILKQLCHSLIRDLLGTIKPAKSKSVTRGQKGIVTIPPISSKHQNTTSLHSYRSHY